jgi:flagellin-specific chaperone FliS
MSPTEMAYRKTALAGASGFGLMIALYDTLAGDMLRAAEAERSNEIGIRCQQVNHALLVVAYLEDWIHRGSGGTLARQLLGFYGSLRRKMIEAEAKRSPEILEEQVTRVLEIRAIWQKLELREASSPASNHTPVQAPAYPGSSPALQERSSSGWTA